MKQVVWVIENVLVTLQYEMMWVEKTSDIL